MSELIEEVPASPEESFTAFRQRMIAEAIAKDYGIVHYRVLYRSGSIADILPDAALPGEDDVVEFTCQRRAASK